MYHQKRFDCAIVGAGPAGSALGYYLAMAGFSVLLIDKAAFPRNKLCGGGLPLRITKLFDFSLDHLKENTIKGIEFTYKLKTPHLVENSQPFLFTVKREKFDQFLLNKALSAGSTVKTGESLQSIEFKKDWVALTTSRNGYSAKVLIGADGVHSKVAKLAGFHFTRRMIPTLQATLPKVANPEVIKVDFGSIPYGYCWSFPSGRTTLVGVGGLRASSSKLRKYLHRWLNFCTPGISPTKIEGFPIPIGGVSQSISKERVCLIGDAANMAHPFTGEGIYYAMKSALLAGLSIEESIHKNDFSLINYQKLVEEELYPYFRKWYLLAGLFYRFPRVGYEILIRRNKNLLNFFR